MRFAVTADLALRPVASLRPEMGRLFGWNVCLGQEGPKLIGLFPAVGG